MGFGSMFGSMIKRPFKDIHKAVKKVGGGVNSIFGGGGKAQKGGPMLDNNAAPRKGSMFGNMRSRLKGSAQVHNNAKTGALSSFASTMKNTPPKVVGSKGKKSGEWSGSKYLGPK